ERRAHIAQHNRKGFARRQGAESQLRAAEGLNAETSAQLTALEAERAKLTRFWHYFKRRALERRTAAARMAVESAGASLRQGRRRTAARHQGDADTAPLADSLALSEGDVLALAALGAQADKLPNVLAEDTWDLFRVLLR